MARVPDDDLPGSALRPSRVVPEDDLPGVVAAPPSGFFGGLGSAVAEGAEKTYRSARAALSTYLNLGNDVVTQAGETARVEKDSRASDLKALKQDIQQRKTFDDDSIWSGIKNVAGAVVDNPRGAAQLLAEQVPNSAVALGSGLAGAKGGALVGSAILPGAGTAVGGTIGFLAGLFGANTLLETGSKAIEAGQDKQFTPEERSQAIREGTTKGAVITAVDAATLGASKFVLGAANRAVEQATVRTLSDAGVDAAKAAASISQAQREALAASRGAGRQATQEAVEKATVEAMGKAGLLNPDLVSAVQAAQKSAFDTTTTLGKRAGRGGAALGLQSFGEGFGEGLGEYAATGEFSPTEAALESVAGLSMSLPELYVAKRLDAPGELTSAYSARRPDAPPAPPPAPGALEQLGTATQELEQSVTSYLTPNDVVQSTSVDEAIAKATELAAAPLPSPTLEERILAAEAPGLVSRQLEIQRQLDEQAGIEAPAGPLRGREELPRLPAAEPVAVAPAPARAAVTVPELEPIRAALSNRDFMAQVSDTDRQQLLSLASALSNRTLPEPTRETLAQEARTLIGQYQAAQQPDQQYLARTAAAGPALTQGIPDTNLLPPTRPPATPQAPVDFTPTDTLQATTSLGAAPDTRVEGIEPAGLVRAFDEPAPTGGRSATKQSEIPAVPGIPGVADTLNVNLAGQTGATDQQNATLLGEPRDPGTELAKQRVAAGYQAPPAAPRPQKVGGTAVAQLTSDQLTQMAGDAKLPAITRRGAQIELGYRASEVSATAPAATAAAPAAPETVALPQTTTPATPKLDQARPGVILTSNAKMSSARPAAPGGTGTLDDNGVQHTYTVVDPGKLGTPGKMISQVARIFGKKLVVFESDSLQSDGFVLDDDSSSVYLNAKSSVSPLAVFGHEMVHLLKRDNAQAYAALEAVVQRNVDAKGMERFQADYGKGANLEELASDLTGNRFQEPEFWNNVFGEIAAQNPTGARAVILKVAATLNKAVNAFKRAVSGQGFNADSYVKDLDAVKAAVKTAVVQYAQQQREPAMRMEAELMRAESQVNLTAGSSSPASVSQAAPVTAGATAAPTSAEDELAEVEAQSARFSRERGYDTDAYEGEGRGRAVDTAGARGVQADAGQDRSAPGRDGGSAAPSYGTAREGAISVVARHYSREPRQSLNGAFFGTGLKGAERDRLASSPDPRIRSRVYFYVDNGKGIRPESGVGGYAHEVQLNNIYDPATRLVPPQPNSNSFESAVLNAGFDGYIDRQFTTQQGAVVLLGPKHVNVPVRQLGQVAAAAAPAPAVASTLKRGLMSRELNSIDTANIPGARVRMGNLEIPADQVAAANAELQRIGSTARFSAKRPIPGPDASVQSENRMAVVVGAKPGEFNWNFSRSDLTPPPPFAAPTQNGPRLEKIGESVYEILRSNGFKKLAEDAFGIKGLRVAPVHGSWLNKPEPSFALYADGLTFEQANDLSKMLGFGFAQDATVVFQPTSEESPGEIPAVYVGSNKKLTDEQMKAVLSSAQAEGVDYSSTADGKAVRFLHFGDAAGLTELTQKAARIASNAGLGAPKVVLVRSQLNESESYTKGRGQGDSRAEWVRDGGAGRSDLFRRTVDHVLVPYAKAVGAEGYRFAVSRFGKRFGLSADQQGLIRQALLPKSGADKATVDIASGKVKLDIKATGARGNVSVSDILWALQNRSAQGGLIEPGDYSDQARKLIAEAIAEEVIYNVNDTSTGKSAIGWYDRALKAAKNKYASIFPEVQTDPDRGLLFDAVLGITSQGNDVFSNSVFAGRIYELVTRQNMTLSQAVAALKGSFGGETVAIENNLLKLEELLDRNGYDAMRKFFNKKNTVSNINARLRSDTSLFYKNKPLSVDGAADQRVTGWMVFGPKIGSFINNLHGDYSTLTADLWFSRTWNRILGFSFVHAPALEAEQYQTFMSALVAEYGFAKDREGPIQPKRITPSGEAKMPEFGNDAAALTDAEVAQIIADPDEALRYATELEQIYRKGGYKAKSDLRRAAKNWIENRRDPVALPRTDYERDFQQRTVETAQKIIKRRTGNEITIADIQAALWYYEKDNLFKLLGGTNKKSEAADYAGAAEETVRSYQAGDLFYAKTDDRYVYGSKGSYQQAPGAQLSRARKRSAADISIAELQGRQVSMPVRVEDTGETGTLTMDAGDSLADINEREAAMQRLLECLRK